jgi:ribulose-bisphosphate carboxylase large chain
MHTQDVKEFFADLSSLVGEDYLLLDYSFECFGDPEQAAAHLCSEQSTAQWKRVGVDEDYRPRHAAKVVALDYSPEQKPLSYPLAPSTQQDRLAWHCQVQIAHPHRNFGPRLPNLLSAILGEGVFFAPNIPLIKLLNIHLPASFLQHFEGPQFGIAGLRDQLKVYDRPFFFGVVKPNIGLDPEAFSLLAYQAWQGGLDIAKDDEMLADTDWSPVIERTQRLGQWRHRVEQETGTPKMYLANITDEVDNITHLHDQVVAAGANAVMLNAMPLGLSAARWLRRHARVPMIAHFPLFAALTRLPYYGVHSRVFTLLQRLAGFDAIIMPGFGSRMFTSATEVLANIEACLDPTFGHIAPSLPVPGGSDSAATLEQVYQQIGHVDFGFIPGRGIFGHPMGPKSGAASLHQAWQAIAQGIPVTEYAHQQPELQAALTAFTSPSAQ